MRRRAAQLLAAGLVAGCGGGDNVPDAEAQRIADDFTAALVEENDEERGRAHATERMRDDVDDWIVYLRGSGIERVERGALRRNCVRPFPVFAAAEPGDCFAYAVSGRGGRGRLRIWVAEGEDGWRVSYVDYAPRIGAN